MEESKKSDPSQTLIPYKKSKEISRLQVKQAVPQTQQKPRGSVLDAAASSYLPHGNIADCGSIMKKVRDKVPEKQKAAAHTLPYRDSLFFLCYASSFVAITCLPS